MIPMSSRCTFTAFHVHASSTHTRCVLATSPSEPWITPLFYVLLPGSCWVRASRIKRSPSPQFVLILLTLIDLLLDTLAPVECWMSAITHFQSYFSIPGSRSQLTSFHLSLILRALQGVNWVLGWSCWVIYILQFHGVWFSFSAKKMKYTFSTKRRLLFLYWSPY